MISSGTLAFKPLDWGVVRAPLLPVDLYSRVAEVLSVEGPLLEQIDEWANEPRVAHAIALASPSLYAALRKVESKGVKSAKRRRLRSALLRYLVRMCSRTTPYGLFAGVGLCEFGNETDLEIDGEPVKTRTRVDMGYLVDLVGLLIEQADVRNQLYVVTDSSVYLTGRRVRTHQRSGISALATTGVLYALEFAQRPVQYAELADGLMRATQQAREDVDKLLMNLLSGRFLIAELVPSLSNTAPLEHILQVLRARKLDAELCVKLERIERGLSAIDEDWTNRAFTSMVDEVKRLSPLGEKTPLQTDAALQLRGKQVTRWIAGEAARTAEVLLRLSPEPMGSSELAAYALAFEVRYGRRSVPLIEVLDPDLGLGSPFRDGQSTSLPEDKRRERSQTLTRLLATALNDRSQSIQLTESTLKALETSQLSMEAPLSMELCLLVSAKSVQHLDRGEFLAVVGPNVGAPEAGRSLGRFSDMFPGAPQLFAEIAAAESEADRSCHAVELVYPVDGRLANVVVRHSPRASEAGLDTTVSPSRPMLRADELMLSLRNGRFVVTHRGDPIRACTSHMLNSMSAPTLCRFLETVSRYGRPRLQTFSWEHLENSPFLPRVVYGRTVLRLAQWLPDMQRDLPTPAAFGDWVKEYRDRWRVPRHVYLRTSKDSPDNWLLLDLDVPVFVDELREQMTAARRDKGQVWLTEALPAPDAHWLKGPRGTYAVECVVPLVRVAQTRPERGDETRPDSHLEGPIFPSRLRSRPPGTEWIYVKLYCPEDSQVHLLIGPVAEFASVALECGWATDWFFIRYSDPEPHIRLRFFGEKVRLTSELLPALLAWANELWRDGEIKEFTINTYEREIERYGGVQAMYIAERLFALDSVYGVQLLHRLGSGVSPERLIEVAALSVHHLLQSLSDDLDERIRAAKRFPSPGPQVREHYRRRASHLQAQVLEREPTAVDSPHELLVARTAAMREWTSWYAGQEAARCLTCPRESLLVSFLHMHCNRLLGTNREREQHAIELFVRTQASLAARRTSANPEHSIP